MANELEAVEEEDLIAGYEFTEARRPMASWQPELRLMFEVLCDAIRVYQGVSTPYDGRVYPTELRRAEAEAWIFDRWRDRDDSIFTFGSICLALGIDRDKLRGGLIASKEDGRRKVGRRGPARGVCGSLVSTDRVRARQGVGSRRA
jgi:hypothetical protein